MKRGDDAIENRDVENAQMDRSFTFQILRDNLFPGAAPGAETVHPDASLTKAISVMMRHDYSQLPVAKSKSDCWGAVSWESIARSRSYNSGAQLRDCIVSVDECYLSDDVLSNLPRIMARVFIVLKDDKKRIAGVVTVSDITNAFGALAGPFLRLGQVETRLRVIAREYKFPVPRSSTNQPQIVDDLAFGELKALFDMPGNWEQLSWNVDRGQFLGLMDDVVRYRNIVMHFRRPAPRDPDEHVLRNLTAWLDRLEPPQSH